MNASRMTMAQYLALPAVSASVLKRIVDECPAAGWFESWLNTEREQDDTAASDAGSIAHAILLEGDDSIMEVIDPNDHPAEKTGNIPDGWTNKSIRQARDNARLAGKIPVLLEQSIIIRAMASSAHGFIDSLKDTEPAVWAAFQRDGGESELTIQWAQDGVPCKIRPDRMSADRKIIIDAKFTKASANPAAWGRAQFVTLGGYMSAAFYRMGLRAAFQTECEYLFLVVEQEAPHLCSLVGTDPHAFALGEEKMRHGLALWSQCMQRGEWPAYPARAVYPEIPAWVDSQWQQAQEAATMDGMEFYDKQFGAQK